MSLEQDVQFLAKQVERLNAYLKERAPSKPTKAPFLVVTAEMSANISASATAVTILTAEVPEGPDFEIVMLTGLAGTSGALPAAVTVDNDWKISITDSHRQIEWFRVAPNITTGVSGRLWARNIFPTVTDPYILPAPYRVPGKTIITCEIENQSAATFTVFQIAFHGYRVA